MLDEAFELKALEYAISILQNSRDGKHGQDMDYALEILKEREAQIKMGKEEKIGLA